MTTHREEAAYLTYLEAERIPEAWELGLSPHATEELRFWRMKALHRARRMAALEHKVWYLTRALEEAEAER